MSIQKPRCRLCGNTTLHELLPSNNWYAGEQADLCYQCASTRTDLSKLDEVDRLLQYLNFAFDPNGWQKVYSRNKDNPIQALRTYIHQQGDTPYAKLSWGEQHQRLLEIADSGLQDYELEALQPSFLAKLRKEWGDLPEPSLLQLEGLYCNNLQDYDAATNQQRDLLKKMSQLSFHLGKKLEMGETDKDLISAYNTFLGTIDKQLQPASGGTNMSSIGQLVEFIERNGFKPNPQIEVPLDELDMIEANLFAYQSALINNDPGIADLFHQRKRLYDERKGIDTHVENA